MQKLTMGVLEWILLLILSVLWGSSFFFNEVALKELQPFTLVLGRVSLAAVALTAFVFLQGKQIPVSLTLWREFLLMGALNNLIPFSLIVWGQTHIDSGLAAILNATTPIFTVVLAHFLTQDERLTFNRLVGTMLGLCGVVVLIGSDALRGLSLNSLGHFAILGAACSYGCAGIYGRRFRKLPPAVAAAGMLISSTILLLPLTLLLERPLTFKPSVTTWGALIGLSLLSTALAYIIYFHILTKAGATNLVLVTFVIPVSSLFLGVFILGEQLHWTTFASMVLIFIGLAAIDGRAIARIRQLIGVS
ncbi:DMT family transporter [Mastigocladopsis repens]|uniref:DMT family transporter n=1 Tax=Mastigocladopsis repens TaxID=221287 RepID=UPI001E308FB5|nr:DMT family transporter [Mastigocladopsis repens]